MIVVADTSPVNYLILIDQVHLLRRLFGGVVIPRAVLTEMQSADAPSLVKAWAASPPHWVDIHHAASVLPVEGLGAGELEAMALADEMNADLLLLDDSDARTIARKRGLTITGLLGVLERAAVRDMIDLPDVLQALRQTTTFYVSDGLVQMVIERANRHRRSE
jgi:predicted nucleic acid-binding protein